MAIKLAVGLLVSLLVFLVPFLRGGERELTIAARLGIFFGAGSVLLFLLWGHVYRDGEWMGRQLRAHRKALWTMVALSVAGLLAYLLVYFAPDVPTRPVFYSAWFGYLLFALGGSALLAAFGYLLAGFIQKDKKQGTGQ